MRTRSNCPNPRCINNIYENPGGYLCGWCRKLAEPSTKIKRSESDLVNGALTKAINLYKANKSDRLSKIIKSLKDNPTVNSLAYMQATELPND